MVGSAKRGLDAIPDDVQDVFGHAIDLAQVLEVVENFLGDSYRAVYTVKFAGWPLFGARRFSGHVLSLPQFPPMA